MPIDRNLTGVQICRACYLDLVVYGPFSDKFRLSADEPSQDSECTWRCLLAKNHNLGMALALDRAGQTLDFNIFSTAARVTGSVPPCTEAGIVNGRWWSLRTTDGAGAAFMMCESCYAGISAFGLGRFFYPRRISSATICGLAPASPRRDHYLLKLTEANDRRVFSYFSNYVKTFAGVPACPGITAVADAKWWGYPDTLFCEECYLDFVCDTSLEDALPCRREHSASIQICQMWSPRMRNLWLETCAAGDPGSVKSDAAVQKFRAVGSHRQEVYGETIMEVENGKKLQEAKQKNGAFYAQMAVKWQGTAALKHLQNDINGTNEGLIYGSSSLGYHDTYAGAEAQKFMNMMMASYTEAERVANPAMVAALMNQWKEVE